MKTLLFLSKVAFIYNACMAIALLILYFNVGGNENIRSTFIIAGFILSYLINSVTNIWLCYKIVKGRPLRSIHPKWLFIVNLSCFIIQLFILVK